MNSIISITLNERIVRILGQLWLYEEFGESPLIGIENRRKILNSISEFAINALEMINDGEDTKLDQLLVELCDAENQDVVNVEQKLHQLLRILSGDDDLPTQNKMNILESIIVSIIEKIKHKPYFEHAREDLTFLDKIVKVGTRLSYSENIVLSDNMDVIVRDFEHADEETVLRSIYKDIRSGVYLSKNQ
jgi:hypothetical protein